MDKETLLQQVDGRIKFLSDIGNIKDVELYSSLLSEINSLNRQLENAKYEWHEAQANYDSCKRKNG